MHHAIIAPYGMFEVGDGTSIVLAIQSQREWRQFCEHVMGDAEVANDPRFATNEARMANHAALVETIETTFSRWTHAQVVARLEEGRIAYGSLNTVAGLCAHPQLRRTEVQTPAGPVRLVATPIRRTGAPHCLGRVPELGEHSSAIREEFAPW